MGEAAQVRDHVGASSVRGQDDFVVPAGNIRRADTGVGHPPRHIHALAGTGRGRHAGGTHHQVGVRDSHHVEYLRGFLAVVGFIAVFEHLRLRVAAHEEVKAPLEVGRQQEGFGTRVGLAHRQGAVVEVLAQHPVVAVAGDGVGGCNQRVCPHGSPAHAGALVGDGPADTDLGRVANGQGRCDDAGGDKLRIVSQGHVEPSGCHVIALRAQLRNIACGVGCDQQVVGAIGPQGQVEFDAAAVTQASSQRAWDGARGQQGVVAVDAGVARQVDPVEPVACGLAGAAVADGVGKRHAVAGDGAGGRVKLPGHQIGVNHRKGCCGCRQVVFRSTACHTLVDLAEHVGDHDDAVVAVPQGGQGEIEECGDRAPGIQVAGMGHVTQIIRAIQGAVAGDIHPVGPGSLGGTASGVVYAPRHTHAFAGHGLGRQGDGAYLQVGQGRRRHCRGLERRCGVVGLEIGFVDPVFCVGANQKPVVARGPVGQEHIGRCGIAVAHRQKLAVAVHLGQQGVVAIQLGVQGEINVVLPLARIGAGIAAVAHAPGNLDRFAAERGGRRRHGFDQQVGMRRGDVDGPRTQGIVAAGVRLQHLGIDIGAQKQLVGAVHTLRQGHLAFLGIGLARCQCAEVRRGDQQYIICIAVDRIAGENQPVTPLVAGGGVTLIGNGPAQRDRVPATGAGGSFQGNRHHVGVFFPGDVECGAGCVVAFRRLHHLAVVVGVDRNGERAHRTQAVRQRERVRAAAAATGRDVAVGGQRGVVAEARVHQGIAGGWVVDADALDPPAGRGGDALVERVPEDGHRGACLAAGRGGAKIAHRQIGRRGHAECGRVVGFRCVRGVVLENPPIAIGGHAEVEAADTRAVRWPQQRDFAVAELALRKRAQHRRVVREGCQVHIAPGAGVAHHDAVCPIAAGGPVAAIAFAPAQRYLGAGRPTGGGADLHVRDLQVGIGRQRGGHAQGGRVVELGRTAGALLGNRILDIGRDPEAQVAGAAVAIGQGELDAVAALGACDERTVNGLVVGDELGEDQLAISVAHHYLVLPAAAGGQRAGIGGIPGKRNDAARMHVA